MSKGKYVLLSCCLAVHDTLPTSSGHIRYRDFVSAKWRFLACGHVVPDTLPTSSGHIRYRDFVPTEGGYSLAVMLPFGRGIRFPISVAEVAQVIFT